MRTITLTGRPPVTINEDAWPVIASASDKDYEGEFEFQSFRTSKWHITVRQHEDGRTLVYATYSYSTAWRNERGLQAKRGELLPKGGACEEHICRAIERVCQDVASAEHSGDDAGRWSELAAECVADMPAEVLA